MVLKSASRAGQVSFPTPPLSGETRYAERQKKPFTSTRQWTRKGIVKDALNGTSGAAREESREENRVIETETSLRLYRDYSRLH